MCTTCGCGHGDNLIDGAPVGEHPHEHRHPNGIVHGHERTHEGGDARGHAVEGSLHWHRHGDGTWHSHVHGGGSVHQAGPGAASGLGAAHAPGVSPARIVQIEQDILAKNNAYAALNRQLLADRGVFALNLVSSPGSGKTTLLVRTIEALRAKVPVAVIEGDQQTSLDADRIRATGTRAVQVNTGKGCHLDAHMVGHALSTLDPAVGSLLLIENVGNLVCPAAFDLGEAHKVVILSVTEGDDKPLKYPDMFHAADLLLINKIDLLPYVRFDIDAAIGYARRVRPGLDAIQVSATTGEGVDGWLAWLERGVAAAKAQRDQDLGALRQRIAELEAAVAGAAVRAGGQPHTTA
jgi:hydrogenase nickel incorporation protein HypB